MVNLIPILMEEKISKVSKIVLFTTERAQNQKWTKNIDNILKKRSIDTQPVDIDQDREHNIKNLVDKMEESVKEYHGWEIILNIGGGQKTFTVAFFELFKRNCEKENLRIVYSEPNGHKLYSIDKNLNLKSERYTIDLGLDEILKLNGYELGNDSETKKIFEAGQKTIDYGKDEEKYFEAETAAEHLKNDRLYQELFYKKLMNDDLGDDETISYEDLIYSDKLKKIISEYKPDSDPKKYNWTNTIIKSVQKIKDAVDRIQKMKNKTLLSASQDIKCIENNAKDIDRVVSRNTISSALNIYCSELAEELKNNLKNNRHNDFPVREKPYNTDEQEKISKMLPCVKFNSEGYLFFGGENTYRLFSEYEKEGKKNNNGFFFEKMVTTEVCRMQKEEKYREKWNDIYQIWVNVTTRRSDSQKDANDAEHDIVIVTKFGTLILIEIKAAKFETSIAKGQERDAFRKSGPYGQSFVIGPLLSEMLDTKDGDRKKEYPFVADAFFKQAAKVENARMSYWCFDKICEDLANALK